MDNRPNWTEWILQKNNETKQEELNKADLIKVAKPKAPKIEVPGTGLHVQYGGTHKQGDGGNKYHIYHGDKKVGITQWDGGVPYTTLHPDHAHHEQAVEDFTGDLPRHEN